MNLINTTEAAILAALGSGGKYGIAIIEAVDRASKGKLKLTIGGIYPTLHRMQEKGLVTSKWGAESESTGGARRRYYSASRAGSLALLELVAAITPKKISDGRFGLSGNVIIGGQK